MGKILFFDVFIDIYEMGILLFQFLWYFVINLIDCSSFIVVLMMVG